MGTDRPDHNCGATCREVTNRAGAPHVRQNLGATATVDVPNLTRDDARVRADLLHVDSYQIYLNLTAGDGTPSDRTFRSRSEIHFSAGTTGSSTFIDLIAESIESATLNGQSIDTSTYTTGDGLVIADLAEQNVLVIDATCLYTNTGEGLHRFVDPVDKEVYLYSQFETADAKRMYACFDQPDLKATFTVTATVASHWTVIANGAVTGVDEHEGRKSWHFATTARMSPYITALIAGPYHQVRRTHDGIDLGLFCRESLAEHLDADELFTITAQGFDWFHANFGVRYAFGKYDQLFVPEFNAGAMENAGAVTFREDYVFRSKVTEARYERRAETILHEMAHMWFGDLVTMRWWDDLWLNESFATYASVLCQVSATKFTGAWTTFANVEKTWAYRQDQLPSTHPIATDAPDVQTAEVNFDGITYAKGASVLKQLGAYVGVDAFLAGLRNYFADHAFGNTTLTDLLAALEQSSGRDLSSWSKLWLETTGINTIRADFELAADGTYQRIALVQSAPDGNSKDNVLRPHRLAVGAYDLNGNGVLVRTARVELDVSGERSDITELVGTAQPALLLVNDDDLTYAKVRLDERSLAFLVDGGLSQLADSLPRGLIWAAAWDMVRDGELATRDYLALVLTNIDAETDIGVVQSVQRQVRRALEVYANPADVDGSWARWADKTVASMRAAEPGSDHQLAWVHAFLAASTPDKAHAVRDLLSGAEQLPGLSLDTDLRWSFLLTLAALGASSEDEITAAADADPSAAGARYAASARASIPTAEAKAQAWIQATEDDSITNATQEAIIGGFAHPSQGALLTPYVEKYFATIGDVWRRRSSELAQNVVVGLFPHWSSTIEPATVVAADAFLAGSDVPKALYRLVSEGRADVIRAIAARQVDIARSAADEDRADHAQADGAVGANDGKDGKKKKKHKLGKHRSKD
jgi:aminopeptidase N